MTIDLATARRSSFFSALPPSVQQAWVGALRPVRLLRGAPLYDPVEPVRHVTFPLDAVIAVVTGTPAGGTAMMWMLGHEGFVGMPAVMSGKFLQARGTVLLEGDGMEMPRELMTEGFHGHRELRSTVMRYVQAMIIHAGQLTLCNRHCTPDRQLATVLLRAMDRKRSAILEVTQDSLANVLGWRRETLTNAVLRLQARGALEHRRGHILLPDRAATERQACTCYASLQDSYSEVWTAPHWPSPEAAPR